MIYKNKRIRACKRLIQKCVDCLEQCPGGIDDILGGPGFDAYAEMCWWEQRLIDLDDRYESRGYQYWMSRFPYKRFAK